MTDVSLTPVEGALKPPESEHKSLSQRLMSGAAIEVGSYGFLQVVRLGSNLVLTRLLVPEAFGLMSMLGLVLYGLGMLSDVGISQAVIRSERGDDPVYLNTAWTMQALRGAMLWGLASVLAYPAALWFKEPQLVYIIPIGSFGVFIHALSSTRMFTMRRRLRPGPLAIVEILSQGIGVAVMIVCAKFGMHVWSLVVGNLVMSVTHVIASFLIPGEHRERFQIDPVARADIMSFGRWIFAASAVTFGASRGDQVVLARLLGAESLGFYNIGLALAEAPEAIGNRVVSGLFYPLFARVHNETPDELRRVYYRVRLAFDAVLQTGLGFIFAVAPLVISLLYDPRYQAASYMLQVLAIRTAFNLVAVPCETCLTAQGMSVYGFRRNAFVAVSVFVLLPIGHYFGGVNGVLWASAFSRISALLALWPAARERGILSLRRESLVFVFLGLGYGLGEGVLWLVDLVRHP